MAAAVAVVAVAIGCLGQAHAQKFRAVGNTDSKHRAAPWHKGEVVVTFDTMPTRMSFDLPCYPKMITENGIQYINGATETYIDGFAEGQSYEVWNDKQNVYSRFWIESQNDARIVVRHRNALVRDGKIAHARQRKVSPYGPGEWTDEWFTFHPDGTHTRRVRVYTPAAATSKPWPAQPISRSISRSGGLPEVSVHELEGMYLMGRGPGRLVGDELEKEGLTLIKMDGSHKDIPFDPYPLRLNASGEGMYRAYGDFKHANIHVVKTKSTWRPFRIGRPNERLDGPPHFLLLMTPYKPVHRLTNLVPSFPAGATRRKGYFLAGLGQMQYTRHWKTTRDTINEIWLNGFTKSKAPAKELATLARSWLQAPAMRPLSGAGTAAYGYDMAARAYLVGVKPGGQPAALEVELAASAASPVVNPTFLVNHWGRRKAVLDIDGTTVPGGRDLRLGHYRALDLEDGRTWRDVLIVWVRVQSTEPIRFTIRRGGPASVGTGAPFRPWRSVKGTSVEARLVEDTGMRVTLERRSGRRIQVERTYLSPEDRQYLDTLRQKPGTSAAP